jgi:hypothetical protein
MPISWFCQECGANLTGATRLCPSPEVIILHKVGNCPRCGETDLKSIPPGFRRSFGFPLWGFGDRVGGVSKSIVDSRVLTLLDRHARTINSRGRHDIGTYMRNGLTGYGECRRVPCRARFNVGYPVDVPNAEPIITDDTATGAPCPNVLS